MRLPSRQPADLRALHAALQRAHRIMILTGAGVSVASGIPDFRSEGGIWSRIDMRDLSAEALAGGPLKRQRFWQALLSLWSFLPEPRPNEIHEAVVSLQRMGKVCGLVTQNIDGLHQAAGSPLDRLVELHGNLVDCRVEGSDVRLPLREVLARVRAGEVDPHHEGRPIRPDLVLFGDLLPEEGLARARALARQCDLCLVLGSSLLVHPAADLPRLAQRSGASFVLCTLGATPLDEYVDLKVDRPLFEGFVPVVSRLARAQR